MLVLLHTSKCIYSIISIKPIEQFQKPNVHFAFNIYLTSTLSSLWLSDQILKPTNYYHRWRYFPVADNTGW